jgi:hypothetical protein
MSARPARGYIGLDVDQVEATIDFGVFALEDFAFDFLYVENAVDANPLAIRAIPTTRVRTGGKITGCVVELNGKPDTVNYTLRWGLAA